MTVTKAPGYAAMFGEQPVEGAAPGSTGNGKRPKAQIWLNAGYSIGEPGTEEYRFVSLPVGIPLDASDAIEIKSSNTEFASFQSARNGLLDLVMAKAADLKPGEDCMVNLQLQLRRINDPVVAPSSAAGENQFVPADLTI